MEEKADFLTLLKEQLMKLMEEGLITEEQLHNGIDIDEGWLYSKILDRKDLVRAMIEILRSRTNSYDYKCKETGKDPNKTGNIIITMRDGNIELSVLGSDNFSKFILTNNKNPNNPILQLSPEEFSERIFKSMESDKKRKLEGLLGDRALVIDVLKIMNNRSAREMIGRGVVEGLNEIPQNLGNYYRYLMEEKRIDAELAEQRRQEEEKAKGPEIIYGGILNIEHDERDGYERQGGEKTPKKNEAIDFDKRDGVLRDLNPERIIEFGTMIKEETGGDNIRPYNVYFYSLEPRQKGYIMISEPYSSSQRARVVYLSEEVLDKFLLTGKTRDNEFWKDVSSYYCTMSPSDFKQEKIGYSLNHTLEENYIGTVKGIVEQSRTGNMVKTGNNAIDTRISRVINKIFNGELTPDVESVVKGITGHEIDAMRQALAGPLPDNSLDSKQQTDNSGDGK